MEPGFEPACLLSLSLSLSFVVVVVVVLKHANKRGRGGEGRSVAHSSNTYSFPHHAYTRIRTHITQTLSISLSLTHTHTILESNHAPLRGSPPAAAYHPQPAGSSPVCLVLRLASLAQPCRLAGRALVLSTFPPTTQHNETTFLIGPCTWQKRDGRPVPVCLSVCLSVSNQPGKQKQPRGGGGSIIIDRHGELK
ncbi:hypothetical protein B0T24DRAFT_183863 [Lasiosphaeria ovina]|uniref:Uncharacterized protein n=1 Tax=Lasiosphaeria ovina TaxID=92902 RepID=A0AAE0NER0_9PEZI|nr:hypothetical protein B0T24DRAFT_183863 [Lasiosphaeria ovina]